VNEGRTSIDLSAISVNLPIFEADNRFAWTTSFNIDSKSCIMALILIIMRGTKNKTVRTSREAMVVLNTLSVPVSVRRLGEMIWHRRIVLRSMFVAVCMVCARV